MTGVQTCALPISDEGLVEICVNEFIADTIKAVKDAGVKKITVEF